MLDVALFMANASQLRNVIVSQSYQRSNLSFATLVLVTLSLGLQMIVGMGLLYLAQLNINHEDQKGSERRTKAETWNNWVTACVFLITVVNGLISTIE